MPPDMCGGFKVGDRVVWIHAEPATAIVRVVLAVDEESGSFWAKPVLGGEPFTYRMDSHRLVPPDDIRYFVMTRSSAVPYVNKNNAFAQFDTHRDCVLLSVVNFTKGTVEILRKR